MGSPAFCIPFVQHFVFDLLQYSEPARQHADNSWAAGQHWEADQGAKRAMHEALHNLAALTDGILDRRGEDVLQKMLPAKHEHVMQLRLPPAQEAMYMAYLEVIFIFIFSL